MPCPCGRAHALPFEVWRVSRVQSLLRASIGTASEYRYTKSVIVVVPLCTEPNQRSIRFTGCHRCSTLLVPTPHSPHFHPIRPEAIQHTHTYSQKHHHHHDTKITGPPLLLIDQTLHISNVYITAIDSQSKEKDIHTELWYGVRAPSEMLRQVQREQAAAFTAATCCGAVFHCPYLAFLGAPSRASSSLNNPYVSLPRLARVACAG